MRILCITHAYPPTIGGVESHVHDVAHTLAALGHTVHCVVGGQTTTEMDGRVRVHRHPELSVDYLLAKREGYGPGDTNWHLLSRLTEVVHGEATVFSPDIVHVHNAHHFAPELGRACFGLGVPAANSVHDRVGEHVYAEVLAYDWDLTLFASAFLKNALPRPHGRSEVLHLGIDLTRFSHAGPRDRRLTDLEPPVVFHPARLLRWKGPDVSLQAFAILRAALSSGTLVLSASERIVESSKTVSELRTELELRAEALGIQGHVRFFDFAVAEMPAAYRAVSAVWYPTVDDEPFGLVPIEAMACGTPVLVSDSGGMRETVSHGVNGIVVPKSDPRGLAAATVELLRNPEALARISSAARARSETFALNRYVDQLIDRYEECIRAATDAGAGGPSRLSAASEDDRRPGAGAGS